MSNIATISINNLKLSAIIGIHDYEKQQKQPLIIDTTITYDASQAIATDDFSHAICYANLSQQITDCVTDSNFNLVETLAHNLINSIKAIHKNLLHITINISKPQALKCADTIVQMEWNSSNSDN